MMGELRFPEERSDDQRADAEIWFDPIDEAEGQPRSPYGGLDRKSYIGSYVLLSLILIGLLVFILLRIELDRETSRNLGLGIIAVCLMIMTVLSCYRSKNIGKPPLMALRF